MAAKKGNLIHELPKTEGIRIGIIQTKSQLEKTKLDIYDQNCNQIGSNDYKQDYGAVVGFDLDTGKMQEISFDRTNLTDLRVTRDHLYAISNLNNETYIDRYNFAEKKIDSFCWNKDAATDFAVSDTGNIYFSDIDGVLYSLEFDSGGQFYDDGSFLYVASASPVQLYDDGFIVKIDMETEKIISKWDFDFNVYQYQICDNYLSILNCNDNELRQYSIKGDKLTLAHQIPIEVGEDYHLSGMGFCPQ